MVAYRKVYEELCKLERLVEGITTGGFTRSRNPEEVGKMVETVNAYTECIQRAVVGWHEHTSHFFVERTWSCILHSDARSDSHLRLYTCSQRTRLLRSA